MAQIRSKPFGVTKEGANVTEYILSNPGGMSVSVLDYGCVIKNIIVPAKNGPVDVVLGHDTMADYENDFTSSGSTCCGAFVGRYANRIENAVFTLGGKTYTGTNVLGVTVSQQGVLGIAKTANAGNPPSSSAIFPPDPRASKRRSRAEYPRGFSHPSAPESARWSRFPASAARRTSGAAPRFLPNAR